MPWQACSPRCSTCTWGSRWSPRPPPRWRRCLLLRPSLVGRLHGGPELRLGHTRLVGKQALVTEDITGTLVGRIRLDGEIWSALPYDDTLTIPAGATVEVLEIRGATALVHPIAQLEP